MGWREGNKGFLIIQVVMGILLMISAMAFGRLAYGVVMPFMREDLSLNYGQAGMLGTAIALGYLGMVVFAGLLAARWGSKQIVLVGGGLISLSMLGLAWVPSYGWSFFLLVTAGMGTALIFTPLVSLIVGWIPERKGLAIGSLTSGVGIGMLLVGMIVPMAVDYFPDWRWRAVWAFFGIYTMIIVIFAAVLLKNPPIINSKSPGQPDHSKTDVMNAVYKKKEVLIIAILYFFVGMAYLIPMTFHMGFMLDSGIHSHAAGHIIALNGILSIFSGPVWGYFSDRVGRRTALIFSLWLIVAATAIPIVFPNLMGFLWCQIIIGSTMGGMLSQIQASATEAVPPALMPVSLGYVTIYFASGQLFGPGIAGWIIDHLGGFKSAYLFSVIMTMLGLVFAYKIKRAKGESMMEIPVRKVEL